MPFDWMHPEVPDAVRARSPGARRAMVEDDVKTRAGLLQRLGYDANYAVKRCTGNLSWGYELRGASPLGEEEIRSLVQQVYTRSGASSE